MPQYTVSHLERINKVKNALANQLPGIFLAGSSYEGLGIPGYIYSRGNAVKNVLQFQG
jgi:oxygen-dependent protoporphyrinogen oxidase